MGRIAQKSLFCLVRQKRLIYGGEEETRTPAPVSRPTPLAGAPRHQLEYFSISVIVFYNIKIGGESGIRTHGTRKSTTVFKTVPL